MATFVEKLQLLIESAGGKQAAAEIEAVAAAGENANTQQKLLAVGTAYAKQKMQEMGLTAEQSGAALGVATAAAAGFVGLKLDEHVKGLADDFANYADSVRKFQGTSGASAQDASRWVVALDDLGVSLDKGANGAYMLGKNVENNASKLEAFGVQVKQNADGTTDLSGTLEAVADRFTKIKDPAERDALAAAAFGKAGKDLIPVLQMGSDGLRAFFDEADRAGMVLDQSKLNMAKDYALAWQQLNTATQGLKLQLGEAVAPAFTSVANSLTDMVLALDGASGGVNVLGEGLDSLVKMTVGPAKAAADNLNVITQAAHGNFVDAGKSAANMATNLLGLGDAFDMSGTSAADASELQQKYNEAVNKAVGLAVQHGSATKDVASAAKDAASAQDALTSATKNVADAMQTEAERAQAVIDAQLQIAGGQVAVQAAQQKTVESLQKYNDLLVFGPAQGQSVLDFQNALADAHNGVDQALVGQLQAAEKLAVQQLGPGADADAQAAASTKAVDDTVIGLWNSSQTAQVELGKLGFAVVTLPDGHQIVITQNAPAATGDVDTLHSAVTQLPTYWPITFDAITAGAVDKVTGLGDAIKRLGQSVGATAAPGGAPAPAPLPFLGGGGGALPPGVALQGADGTTVSPYGDDVAGGTPLLGGAVTPLVAAPSGAFAQPVALNITLNVVTTGLGADAPEIQRAVVNALRGYVERNGRITGVAA